MTFAVADGRRGWTLERVAGRCEGMTVVCAGCGVRRYWPPDRLETTFPPHTTLGDLARRLVCACGARDGDLSLTPDTRLAAEASLAEPSRKARGKRRGRPEDLRGYQRIPHGPEARLKDYQLYPGCRVMLFCSACSFARSYGPGRIIDRMRALRTGGHETLVADVAVAVGWPCPACGRMRWASQLAYPADLDPREQRRLANRYRN